MCAPLDVARKAGRQQLFWKPFGIYESRTGQDQELLDLLDMLRSTQRHCQNSMAWLVDCNIHYRLLKFLYSRATIEWNFPDWLRGILLIYGVWHPTNMFAISSGVNSFLCFRTSPLPFLGPVRAYITCPNSLS